MEVEWRQAILYVAFIAWKLQDRKEFDIKSLHILDNFCSNDSFIVSSINIEWTKNSLIQQQNDKIKLLSNSHDQTI
jgi:ribosomal silencing factor RsfS